MNEGISTILHLHSHLDSGPYLGKNIHCLIPPSLCTGRLLADGDDVGAVAMGVLAIVAGASAASLDERRGEEPSSIGPNHAIRKLHRRRQSVGDTLLTQRDLAPT